MKKKKDYIYRKVKIRDKDLTYKVGNITITESKYANLIINRKALDKIQIKKVMKNKKNKR